MASANSDDSKDNNHDNGDNGGSTNDHHNRTDCQLRSENDNLDSVPLAVPATGGLAEVPESVFTTGYGTPPF